MTRLLVLGLLLVILWLAVKNVTFQFRASFGQGAGRPAPPAPRTETLVRCARCGTFVVPSRALKGVGEGDFCSEECKGAGATCGRPPAHAG